MRLSVLTVFIGQSRVEWPLGLSAKTIFKYFVYTTATVTRHTHTYSLQRSSSGTLGCSSMRVCCYTSNYRKYHHSTRHLEWQVTLSEPCTLILSHTPHKYCSSLGCTNFGLYLRRYSRFQKSKTTIGRVGENDPLS